VGQVRLTESGVAGVTHKRPLRLSTSPHLTCELLIALNPHHHCAVATLRTSKRESVHAGGALCQKTRLQLSYSAAQASRYQGDRWARWTIKPMRLTSGIKALRRAGRTVWLPHTPLGAKPARCSEDLLITIAGSSMTALGGSSRAEVRENLYAPWVRPAHARKRRSP
jgi:hypothetical protein